MNAEVWAFLLGVPVGAGIFILGMLIAVWIGWINR